MQKGRETARQAYKVVERGNEQEERQTEIVIIKVEGIGLNVDSWTGLVTGKEEDISVNVAR